MTFRRPPVHLVLRRLAMFALLGASLLAAAPGSAAAAASKTWYVSASAGTDPACARASHSNPFATIAGALACAHSGDTVKIGAGTFGGGFTVAANVILDGAGANLTQISDSNSISNPEVTVAAGVSETIENLTVNGDAKNTGIVSDSGSLTLTKLAVTNILGRGGVGPQAPVSVIPATGSANLTVTDSTIAGNLNTTAGAILVQTTTGTAPSTATVVNSTLSDNAGTTFGAVYVYNTNLTLRDDTVSGNSGGDTGGLYVDGYATAQVADSVIAANTSDAAPDSTDCSISNTFGAKLIDGGYNLIGVASPGTGHDCGFVSGANGDITGTLGSPLNPGLGALAANGGPTPTQALQPGSPAIGAGNPSDCAASPVSNLDQRGQSRAASTRFVCDIGAYDTGGHAGTTWYVSHTAKSNPSCSAASASDPFATIAGALGCANNGDTVKIGAGTFAGGFTVGVNVTLAGAGANHTTISDPGQIDAPLVALAPQVSGVIEGLAVNGTGDNGGILAGTGSLTLVKVAVEQTGFNRQTSAAVSAAPGTGSDRLVVLDSTVSGNLGAQTGGIAVNPSSSTAPASSVSVINSTISGNQGESYGGVDAVDTALTLRDDTIAGNYGTYAGGLELNSNAEATVTDTLIATNTTDGANPPDDDCARIHNSSATLNDGGNNLIGETGSGAEQSCGFGASSDITGTTGSPLNPDLGTLAANGGPTETQALLAGSPAIGAASAVDCEATPVNDTDQRGDTRNAPSRNACDIGAYDTGGA